MIVNRFKGADLCFCLLFNPSTQQETVTRHLFKKIKLQTQLHTPRNTLLYYFENVSFPPAAAHTAFVWDYFSVSIKKMCIGEFFFTFFFFFIAAVYVENKLQCPYIRPRSFIGFVDNRNKSPPPSITVHSHHCTANNKLTDWLLHDLIHCRNYYLLTGGTWTAETCD